MPSDWPQLLPSLTLCEQESLDKLLKAYSHQAAKEKAENRLIDFARQAWHVVEPNKIFVENWHHGAIAECLEACAKGQIRNLVINVPPRHTKSLLASVFFPTWLWTTKPETRFLYSSYAQGLSIRDALKSRRVIESAWYRARWGNVFKLTSDQNQKSRYENDKTGYRIATSVSGSATGEGGDYIVCFPAWQLIHTERGPLPIGRVVRERMKLRVPSWNQETSQVELQAITGWHENPGSRLIRVVTERGSFECTPDHRILTSEGWLAAECLQSGSFLAAVDESQIARCSRPQSATPNVRDVPWWNSKSSSSIFGAFQRSVNFPGDSSGDNSPRFPIARIAVLLDAIGDVLASRAIADVFRSAVHRVAIQMPYVMADWPLAYEGAGDQDVAFDVDRLSVQSQDHARITLARSSFQDAARDLERETISRDDSRQAANAPESGGFVIGKAGNGSPLLTRVIAVQDAGFASLTYCLSVAHNRSFVVVHSNTIVANCDDPHNVKERESEVKRSEVVAWWDEVMSTRMNDPKKGVKIIIMQRCHESDLAGHVLAEGGYDHLCLPAEYESKRTFATRQLVTDPRSEDGELLWENRFGEEEIKAQKKELGSYGYAAQCQQHPTPIEGGLAKRKWWRYWNGNLPETFDEMLQSWDMSFKDTDDSAYVAGGVWARKGADKYLLDQIREKLDFVRTLEAVDTLTRRWPDAHAKLVEDKANGPAVISVLKHRIPGLIAVDPQGDKIARASAVTPQIEAGNVYVPDPHMPGYAWVHDYIKEWADAPFGDYWDQIDETSQALMRLSKTRGVFF